MKAIFDWLIGVNVILAVFQLYRGVNKFYIKFLKINLYIRIYIVLGAVVVAKVIGFTTTYAISAYHR
jgi:hypothetical protein